MHILFAIIAEIAVRLEKRLFQKIGIALASGLVEGIMVIINKIQKQMAVIQILNQLNNQ